MESDLKEVLENFFFQSKSDSCEILKTGLINVTYKISVDDRPYILQKINTSIFKSPEIIHNNIDLLNDYLEKDNSSYHLMSPISDRNDKSLFYTTSGDCYRIFDFMENSKTIESATDPDQAWEAAAQFGSFTAHFNDFNSEKLNYPIKDFHNLELRFRQFNDAIKSGDPKRILKSGPSIEVLLNYKWIVQTYLEMVNSYHFKLRVMHHDAKISNVLFDNEDKGLCLIDLDTVMPGHIYSDIGDMIRTYVCPVNEEDVDLEKIIVRKEFLEALEEGYLSQLGKYLSPKERSSIMDSGYIIIYMQALRFMTDYLMNDIYYGAKYADHNYDRSRNQIQLLNNLLSLSGKKTIFPLI